MESERTVVDTLVFGNIVIERTDCSVSARLESDDSLVVTIERSGPRTRKLIPIGTRDAACLSARVNERALGLALGRAWIGMRSYRVVVETEGRYLSLQPRDLETSAFLNGKPREIGKQFGELTAHSDGTIDVLWEVPRTVTLFGQSAEHDPPQPTAEELLIGYAVAAAFGTGGLSVVGLIGRLVEAVPFPV
ncbi:hypothetical protein ACIP5Y_05660 [Nocardia sp. NPDC088792]|uniref:hypothetical protein n=1 Tax=Nocardia sp. NPDC088792 TaxID=3364332 RepID=UPI0037FB4948